MDLAMMYVNYGMSLDVRDKLMERMGWTACECLEWDKQQEKERGKALRKPLPPKPLKKKSTATANNKTIHFWTIYKKKNLFKFRLD